MSTVLSLFKQLVDYHCRLDPMTYWKPSSYKNMLRDRIHDYKSIVYKHKKDNKIIGIAIYNITDDVMTITDFVVDKRHRRRGHGVVMLKTLNEIAKKHKCYAMKLIVSAKNEAALKLYEKFNFCRSTITMYRYV